MKYSAETPTIVSSSNTCVTYDGAGTIMAGNTSTTTLQRYNRSSFVTCDTSTSVFPSAFVSLSPTTDIATVSPLTLNGGHPLVYRNHHSTGATMRRFATVIIMDPNESVPLDECVLYKGEEKLTELTDQELFFELNIKELLDEHNTRRVKHVDRKSKNETNLEPARIRDLRMVVVNGASF